MKDVLILCLCVVGFVKDSFSAPALISQMGESFDESSINNDTNPDPCYIAGNIYYHGQQIARSDECEFCLCVDGEMFCYWQCPDEEEGEEEGGEPASTEVRSTTVRLINNTPATDSIASSIGRLRSTTQSSPQNTSLSRVEATSPHFASTPLDRATMNSSVETTESTDVTSSNTPLSESTTVVTSSEKTVSCFVLGVKYKLGEILPHNTGTCLECKCGSDGRVTCSPNDCVSSEPQDEMFSSRHQDSNSLDMFDVDMF